MNQSQPDLTELSEDPSDEASIDALEAALTEEGEEVEQEEIEEEQEAEGPEVPEQNPDDWKSKTFEVDGLQVSGAELASGYMKDADYRQKTEAAAQLRRESQEIIQAAQQERSQYANQFAPLIRILEQDIVGDQAELNRLAVENPAAWVAKQAEMGVKSQKLNAAYQAQAQLQARNEQVSYQQHQQYVAQEQEALLQKVPEWRDPKKAQTEYAEMVQVGLQLGYTQQELENVFDHRAMMALRLAARAMRRETLKPTPPQGRTVQPNAANPNSGNRPKPADVRKVMQTGTQEQRIKTLADLL